MDYISPFEEKRYKLMFFTGAGVSKESGIPTFDEMPGIRNKLSRDFAESNPVEYMTVLASLAEIIGKAQPNEAHRAIAETGAPVITMNIDKLHNQAGSVDVMEIHGELADGSLVLYGDSAPRYKMAKRLVNLLEYNDAYFVVVGTSFYTMISAQLIREANGRAAKIIVINDNATVKVPQIIEKIQGEPDGAWYYGLDKEDFYRTY